MKLTIKGFIDKVGAVETLRRGFRQVNVLHQPEVKDELGRVSAREQYFPVIIWSEKQTDSRFLSSKDIRSVRTATVYINGERWLNERINDFNYNVKLNLSQWN